MPKEAVKKKVNKKRKMDVNNAQLKYFKKLALQLLMRQEMHSAHLFVHSGE